MDQVHCVPRCSFGSSFLRIRMLPGLAKAYLLRGYVYAEKLGRTSDAKSDWETAVRLHPRGENGRSAARNLEQLAHPKMKPWRADGGEMKKSFLPERRFRSWFPIILRCILVAMLLFELVPEIARASDAMLPAGELFSFKTRGATILQQVDASGGDSADSMAILAGYDTHPLPAGWFATRPKLTVRQKLITPPSVLLGIGSSQSFTFTIAVTDSAPGTHPVKSLDATSDAKWRYIDLNEPVRKSLPCDDISVCFNNTFTCRKIGLFSIVASYSNKYVTDPADSGGTVRVSASIECVDPDPGGGGRSTGPKDLVRFSSAHYSVKEDSGPATLMVERVGAGKGEVTTIYASRDETATVGSDYDEASGFLVWKDGDTNPKPLYVFVTDDNLTEGDERVRLVLKYPTGNAQLGHPSECILTIHDAAKVGLRLDVATDTGSLVFAEGDTVVYRYTLSIPQPPGNVPLSSVSVTDSGCGPLTPQSGDSNGNGKLDLNETWVCECRETLGAVGTFTRSVTATGFGPAGEKVSDQKSITIDVRKKLAAVPDVRGYRQEAAEYDLVQAGLRMALPVREEVSDVPVGQVFAQRPLPGTLVNPGSSVEIWVSRDEPRYLFLDPPRSTIQVGEEVRFSVSLITKDRNVLDLAPGEVTWNPGPLNVFRGVTAGEFTVAASAKGVSGWATVIVEEQERTVWDRPISHADELTKRALPPPPDAFTWYALCVKASGDIVYGEDVTPVKFDILGGPFQGPRDAAFWIRNHYPSWRCTSGSLPRGEWNVFCDKQRFSVVLGKYSAFDATRFWIMQGGFSGEKDARAWTVKNCPTWMCSEGGVCATTPRGGGDWAVVCSKAHGGIGLTRQPDPVTHWIFASGLLGEKDARLWVNLKCPSWRCDRDGRCVPGVARQRERPLELPPDLSGRRFGAAEEIGGEEAERIVGDRREPLSTGTSSSRVVSTPTGTPVRNPVSQAVKQDRGSAAGVTAKADCSALRNEFKKKTDEMTSRAVKLNCYRDNSGNSAYSGCAMDVVGPFFPFWADRVFSDEACKSGYAACMAGPFSAYLGCLDACNSAFRSGGGDLKACGQQCNQQMQAADKRCKQK